MNRRLLKSKIHRVRVTEADLDYNGSITVDAELLEAADILEHEEVQIYNVTNGSRLSTYAIAAPRGSGTICINGAAAHLCSVDDLVILASYANYNTSELQDHRPAVILVDEENRIRQKVTA
jgi:aspartate 1-decarboxylase